MNLRPLLLLAALVSVARPAGAADDVRAKVKALYESATKHYNLSEYQEALQSYKEAYRLKDDPAFLFNIAQCNRQLNDPAAASKSYRAYLRESPNARNRAAVEKLIEEMDRAVQERRISQPPLGTEPPGKVPETNNNPTGDTPPETPPPGDKPADSGGEQQPFYKDVVGDVLVVGGVVVIGAATGMIVAASGLDAQSRMDGTDLRTRASAFETGGTLSAASYASFGIGAVLMAAGVVKWLTRPKAAAGVGWNVDLRPGQVFAGVTGSF